MEPLHEPRSERPRMYGAEAPSTPLPWSWARERLKAARTYWIVSTRPEGGPHARPVWGVWFDEGFLFSTGSLARRNLAVTPEITVHLESGDEVVILEGTAGRVTAPEALQRFVDEYNPKYGWQCRPTEDGVTDPDGNTGPVYLVRPRVAFGWTEDLMGTATRWSFEVT